MSEPNCDTLDEIDSVWDRLLRALQPADFARRLRHPLNGVMIVDNLVNRSARHSRHRISQVVAFRKREGWN